jgi:hypothetical protein
MSLKMAHPTLSAYIQCASNPAALYHALHSFRTFYPTETVTLISDRGDDLQPFADCFDLRYCYATDKCEPGRLGHDGAEGFLRRIYQHCISCDSDFVLLLEEDVRTLRRARHFPGTACGGPRLNEFSPALAACLADVIGAVERPGYGMCGGSVFNREAYVDAYRRVGQAVLKLSALDPGIIRNCDLLLTALFLLGGHRYEIWTEVSEIHHPVPELRIMREAAFDHADKRWYDVSFDHRWLERDTSATWETGNEVSDGMNRSGRCIDVFSPKTRVRDVSGFYGLEKGEGRSMWRWMGPLGIVSLRTAKHDMRLTIRVRVPEQMLPPVEVRIAIDGRELDVTNGGPLRSLVYEVSRDMQGVGGYSILELGTDQSFVPGGQDSSNPDRRRLALIVEEVSWEPV